MTASYEGLATVRDYITQADVRINNMEMVLSNYDRFASTYCRGLWLTAEPTVLDDILKYGFNCFGFANNHTMDYSYGGVEITLETEFKNYKGLMPLLEFEGGHVKKTTIKPVELGFYHEDKSVKGLPHNANDAVTQEVLETL